MASELFGLPKNEIQTTSFSTGLKLVNNDIAFEKGLEDAGYDIGKIADYAKNKKVWDEVMKIRDKAKNITQKRQDNYITGRLGQIIDGTGKDFDKIKSYRKLYQDLGYDTYMVFVNTSLEVALERNRNRARKLDDAMVKDMWQEVQDNMGKFQNLFGAENMIIIDNSSYNNADILNKVEKEIKKKLNNSVKNPIGKQWIKDQKNQSVKESQVIGINENQKITVEMPNSMKRWLNKEIKDNTDTWSNELTDLTKEIVQMYREYDLDLSNSDPGPRGVDRSTTPTKELTNKCVEIINNIWPKMSEWAKEHIYDDYEHWFKVQKKDRPYYKQ